MMNVVFRADASIDIGAGHIMRCLTLADALSAQGAQCQFICREHQGNLIEFIRNKGFSVAVLLINDPLTDEAADNLAHTHWLGASWQQDAQACQALLSQAPVDWLVMDHYALDYRWQEALRPYYKKLLVIDDLADRKHLADVLLDQNVGRVQQDYQALVPAACQCLIGPQYALLRPEFAKWRDVSLKRRQRAQLKTILLNLGGVDKDNITEQVLDVLAQSALPDDCAITVVMGHHAPWIAAVQAKAKTVPYPCEVLVGVSNMAQIMANSDLAIGAAGSTSWERCCLGLPSVLLVLAENQIFVANFLHQHQAAIMLESLLQLPELINSLVKSPEYFTAISQSASAMVTGEGVGQLIACLGVEP